MNLFFVVAVGVAEVEEALEEKWQCRVSLTCWKSRQFQVNGEVHFDVIMMIVVALSLSTTGTPTLDT